MPDTFIKIASVTVGSGGTTNIEFTSIPSTYTDLVVKFSLRTNTSAPNQDISVFLNNNGSGYSYRLLYGSGTTTSSSSVSSTPFAAAVAATATSNTFSSGEFYFPNYAGSTNKSYSIDQVLENNITNAGAYLMAGLWSNTAAINQISFQTGSGAFVQYSTATLYGIKNS